MSEYTEVLRPEPARAFAALLDVPAPALDVGAPLPLAWHWLYLLERPRQADLGPDGHPLTGTVPVPPGPGLRRMWAGGRLTLRGHLRCGEPAIRRSAIASSEEKIGRSGRFTVVTVVHEIIQRGSAVVDERQDLVYRERAVAEGSPPAPEAVGEPVPIGPGEWPIPVSPTLLFRFSALTYNAHRIHYDRDYAKQVEHYPGLITHGPLQVMAMAEAARRTHGDAAVGTVFDYRLVSPLFDHQGLIAAASGTARAIEMSVRDTAGRQTAHGRRTGG